MNGSQNTRRTTKGVNRQTKSSQSLQENVQPCLFTSEQTCLRTAENYCISFVAVDRVFGIPGIVGLLLQLANSQKPADVAFSFSKKS